MVGREDAVIINKKLRSILDEYQDAVDKINESAFTCGQEREYLSRYKSTEIAVSQRWVEYIEELAEEGRAGTAGLHKYTKTYFEECFQNQMRFDIIGPAIIKDFDKFLRRKKKLGDTTISMHMKLLKAIINAEKRDNVVSVRLLRYAARRRTRD